MALNINLIKNYSAVLIPQMFTTLIFFILTTFYGLLAGIAGFIFGLVFFTLIGKMLMRNAFTDLIEGKGILAIDITSTGIIRPFIIGLKGKFLKGNVNGDEVKGIFNREAVTQMHTPINVGNHAAFMKDKEGKEKLYINIDLEKYHSSRFQLYTFPTLIYNSQISSIVTKDFLSDQEKGIFAEHILLYLNQKVDELSTHVRDFGRGVVESLKPKQSIFSSWITWLIIIIFFVIMAALFGPAILSTINSSGPAAADSISQVANSAITPR